MVRFKRLILIILLLLNANSCKAGDPESHPKVYKSDGSIQCENEGISLETMAQELIGAGIEIKCSQKGSDGLIRTTVCGASTGYINIYQINQRDLSKAGKLNFRSIEELNDYKDTPCKSFRN